MRHRQSFYFFLLVAFLACTGNNLPKGVLPRKIIVPILVDIHLAEAINSQKYNISMLRDSLPEDLYLSICKKHKIDRSAVESSLLYYGKHPKEYLPVYDEVLDILSEMEVKAKSDSVRPVRVGGFDLDTSKNKKSAPAAKTEIRTN